MFLSILTAIKLRQEVSDGKNTLAYYEMWEKSFIVQALDILLKYVFFLMYDKFPTISTNIKLRLKVSENENTLTYYEMREKSFIVQDPLFHLK